MMQLCKVSAEDQHTIWNHSHHYSLLNRPEYSRNVTLIQMKLNLLKWTLKNILQIRLPKTSINF